jgi:hypothetical protein
MIIEVFKTNVQKEQQAALLLAILTSQFSPLRINFDLEDCDKVLRVEGKQISSGKIIEVLRSNGYQCQVME